jgi:membrane protease YdiL (CAAX protease family)
MQPGLDYHQLHRAGRWSWWRPVVGSVALLVGVFALLPLVLAVPFTLLLAVTGASPEEIAGFFGLDPVTPLSLAFVNLSLATGIHLTILLTAVLHRLTPGWVASVTGRLRVGWLAACFGIATVTLVLTVVVGLVVPLPEDQAMAAETLNDFTTTTLGFLVVIVLLTPLQAAGEEYVFRGYLTQALGGFVQQRLWSTLLAVLVPAFLFAMFHGVQDPPIFFDRFAFGVVSGVLVIRTGGLEAGIAMHVLNNFVAYGLALAFSDITTALHPTGGSWWSLPVTLTESLVYLGLVEAAARSMRVERRTGAAVLSGAAPVLAAGRPGV